MSDDKTTRERYVALFEAGFTPNLDAQKHPSPEERIATAVEYAAYQMGQINQKLTLLLDRMDARQRNPA
jgi:hypothetical protein